MWYHKNHLQANLRKQGLCWLAHQRRPLCEEVCELGSGSLQLGWRDGSQIPLIGYCEIEMLRDVL